MSGAPYAGRIARVPVRSYAGRGLSQEALGREYASARVFVVGSWFEGFCQPGLESLACGTPLVTTDNGGCREYAIDGETALVVPPRDAAAMATAIRRLLDDPVEAERLVANGLELVARDFDWERRTDEFAARLDGLISGPAPALRAVMHTGGHGGRRAAHSAMSSENNSAASWPSAEA